MLFLRSQILNRPQIDLESNKQVPFAKSKFHAGDEDDQLDIESSEDEDDYNSMNPQNGERDSAMSLGRGSNLHSPLQEEIWLLQNELESIELTEQ